MLLGRSGHIERAASVRKDPRWVDSRQSRKVRIGRWGGQRLPVPRIHQICRLNPVYRRTQSLADRQRNRFAGQWIEVAKKSLKIFRRACRETGLPRLEQCGQDGSGEFWIHPVDAQGIQVTQ